MNKKKLYFFVKVEQRVYRERELLYECLRNSKIMSLKNPVAQYQWIGSGSELLELMLAILSSGRIKRIDNKDIIFTTLINDFKVFCNYKIADIKGRKLKLMMRKKNITPFLDFLIQRIISYINKHLG